MLAQPKGFTDDPYVNDEKFIEKVVKHEVVGVIGEGVAIPCNCTPSYAHTGDKPALILWYKDKAKLPIYSFDLRSAPSDGQHWKDHNTLGERGYVFYEESPHSCKSSLNIDPVSVEDSGQYRCRVDYDTSPTRNTRIKLKLVARPTKPVVFSEDGLQILHRTKPVKVGGDLKLYCTSEGGDPPPSLSWRKAKVPLSAVGQDVDSLSGRVTSTVVISGLTPEDQGAMVTCTADNSVLIQPQTATVLLDVIVPPVRAKIVRELSHFTAGDIYNLTCQVLGSRPSALTKMWVGERQLNVVSTKASHDGNVSTSVFRYEALMEDDGQFLGCQARNELIENVAVEDQWRIQVHYKPEVYLSKVGNSSISKVGEDITLKCIIQSNPPHLSVVWTKQGSKLEKERDLQRRSNIHILDDTLHLSNVNDANSGDYGCTVANAAGSSSSNILTITVADAPSCVTNKSQVIEMDIGEENELECSMRWTDGLMFTWTQTSHLDRRTVSVPKSEISSTGSKSVLRYSTLSSADFAEIRCSAMNMEGSTGHPCIYQIILREDAGAAVTECNTYNQTFSSFTIKCSMLEETLTDLSFFLFEIKNAHTKDIIRNVTSYAPELTVKDLPSASDFLISVYSYRNGQKSKVYNMEGFTVRPGEKQLATMREVDSDISYRFIPILGIILLVSLVLVLVTIAVVAIVRRKISRASNSPSSQLELINNQKPDLDYSPDIIPKDSGYYHQSSEVMHSFTSHYIDNSSRTGTKKHNIDKCDPSEPGIQLDISGNLATSPSLLPNIGQLHSSLSTDSYSSMHQNLNTFGKPQEAIKEKCEKKYCLVTEDSKSGTTCLTKAPVSKKTIKSSSKIPSNKYSTLARMEKIHQPKQIVEPNEQYSSTLKRVKFVDQEMVEKDSQKFPEISTSRVHLCPMHKHKLAISTHDIRKEVKRSLQEPSKDSLKVNTISMPIQTFKDVEFKL